MARTAAFPGRWIVNDTGVQSHHILTRCHKGFPPKVFDGSFQFDPNGTVIKESRKSIVYFGTGIDQTPTFAQTNDIIHIKLKINGCDGGCRDSSSYCSSSSLVRRCHGFIGIFLSGRAETRGPLLPYGM